MEIWISYIVLRALLKRQPRLLDEPIFVNRYGQPLGAAGVRFKLKHYVRAASRHVPSLTTKRVTPHTWRHSVGVQLVAAGVDVTVIRDWLGHALCLFLDVTHVVLSPQFVRGFTQNLAVKSMCGDAGIEYRTRAQGGWAAFDVVSP